MVGRWWRVGGELVGSWCVGCGEVMEKWWRVGGQLVCRV